MKSRVQVHLTCCQAPPLVFALACMLLVLVVVTKVTAEFWYSLIDVKKDVKQFEYEQ